MTNKIIVMEKDGVSYIKLGSYGSFNGSYVVNGEVAQPAPGDSSYAIVSGKVTSIEQKRTQSRRVIGYELYDRYKEITQLVHELPADSFYRDDDGDLVGENAELYRPVYDSPLPYLEPVEYEVIDKDCEPVTIPSYVVIDFPNNIGKYREVQHKYPCFISAKDVFNILYDKVAEHVAESDGKFVMDGYRNIQSLRVDERVAIPYYETRTRQYYPTARSRKPKVLTEQVKWKQVRVFEVCGPAYSSYKESNKRTEIIRGLNYAELQSNLEAYIQSYISQLTGGKREVCQHCRGEGIVEAHV